MTYPYSSTDASVVGFVTSQDSGSVRGGTEQFAPGLVYNGIAGMSTDNVIGFSSLAASGTSAIALGTGLNTVIIDGLNSATTAASSSPDNFSFTVSSSGLVTLTDTTTGQTQQVSGVSFLIFDGATIGADGNGNPDYQQMFFIGNAIQTTITELYNAAFGRQPDLAGVEYYVNQFSGGVTFQQIAAEFMASPEFATRYGSGVTDQAFITSLYQNVLHRTPAASEVAYYEAALQNYEAGSVVNTSNPVIWSRAQELLNFATSPENQADTAGFVINTSGTATNGLVYSTPAAASQSATTVLTQAEATGNIDTSTIDPSTITGSIGAKGIQGVVTEGNTEVLPAEPGASAYAYDVYGAPAISTTNTSGIVNLSSSIPNFEGGVLNSAGTSAITVNGSPAGGSVISMESGTVNLSGNNNIFIEDPYGAQPISVGALTVINGWNSSDKLDLSGVDGKESWTFYSPTTASPLQGSGQITTGRGWYGVAIYVGNVGSGSAAEVAAAANLVYVPADYTTEKAVFYGTVTTGTNTGSTALYDWYNYTHQPAGADTHNNHTVTTDDFAGGVILVGVAPSSISASTFYHS